MYSVIFRFLLCDFSLSSDSSISASRLEQQGLLKSQRHDLHSRREDTLNWTEEKSEGRKKNNVSCSKVKL